MEKLPTRVRTEFSIEPMVRGFPNKPVILGCLTILKVRLCFHFALISYCVSLKCTSLSLYYQQQYYVLLKLQTVFIRITVNIYLEVTCFRNPYIILQFVLILRGNRKTYGISVILEIFLCRAAYYNLRGK